MTKKKSQSNLVPKQYTQNKESDSNEKGVIHVYQ